MLRSSGAAVLALTGCSLVVDTTGYSGGVAADAATASDSATASDAAKDAPTSDVDAGVIVENLIPSSDLASTFLNDSQAVTVVTETVALPTGGSGAALECTHTLNKPGYFRRGVKLNLTAGQTYTLSFYFKNESIVDIASKSRFELGIIASTYNTFEEFGATFVNASAAPDGWIRPTLTFTPTKSQVYEIGFNQGVNQSPIGSYRLFGFQLVKGAVAGPYRSTP